MNPSSQQWWNSAKKPPTLLQSTFFNALLCLWNGKKIAILWDTKLLNWVKTDWRKSRESSAPFSHVLFLEDWVCSIRIHLELVFRFGQCPAGVCLSHLHPDCAGLFCPPPKKLINCLAFSWNVAIPVSQGNVVINIITDIIIAVKCYIAGDVGHMPCCPQTSFYLDFQPNFSIAPCQC